MSEKHFASGGIPEDYKYGTSDYPRNQERKFIPAEELPDLNAMSPEELMMAEDEARENGDIERLEEIRAMRGETTGEDQVELKKENVEEQDNGLSQYDEIGDKEAVKELKKDWPEWSSEEDVDFRELADEDKKEDLSPDEHDILMRDKIKKDDQEFIKSRNIGYDDVSKGGRPRSHDSKRPAQMPKYKNRTKPAPPLEVSDVN